jgi:hypothetical protein
LPRDTDQLRADITKHLCAFFPTGPPTFKQYLKKYFNGVFQSFLPTVVIFWTKKTVVLPHFTSIYLILPKSIYLRANITKHLFAFFLTGPPTFKQYLFFSFLKNLES